MAWSHLLDASLNGVGIIVQEIRDDIGRAVVEHAYPDRDGADLEDTGGEPRRISITGYVAGPTWWLDLQALEDAMNAGGTDTLVHPQYGTRTGKIRQISISHRDEEHNLARLQVQFVEGTVRQFSFATGTSVASAAAAVRNAGAAVTAAAAGLV